MKREVYCKHKSSFDLSLDYCGTETCSPDFYMPPHIRNEYLVHYVLDGSGTFTTPQKEYVLRKGDVFLIYPGCPTSYHTSPTEPLRFSWFSFSGLQASSVIPFLGFTPDSCVRQQDRQYSIHAEILTCIDIMDTTPFCSSLLLLSHLYKLFYLLSESCHTISTKRSIVQEHIQNATTYIQLNYIKPITVNDIAIFVGLERSYFSKVFRNCTGMTAQQYLMKTRIEQAKLLLNQTAYSVKEIAFYIGFTDECYFSRVFKKTVGTSPSRYRSLTPPVVGTE